MTTEHVKVPDVTPIVRYVADGIETDFTYPFPIFASEDLRVYLNGAQQPAALPSPAPATQQRHGEL